MQAEAPKRPVKQQTQSIRTNCLEIYDFFKLNTYTTQYKITVYNNMWTTLCIPCVKDDKLVGIRIYKECSILRKICQAQCTGCMLYNSCMKKSTRIVLLSVVLLIIGLTCWQYFFNDKKITISPELLNTEQEGINKKDSNTEPSALKNVVGSIVEKVETATLGSGEEKVAGTENVYSGSGGDHYPLLFSISPSGRYILFRKNTTEYEDPLIPNSSMLALRDMQLQTTKDLPVDWQLVMGLKKDCWTKDEKYCYEAVYPMHTNYTQGYVSLGSELSYTNGSIRKQSIPESELDKLTEGSCSDCVSRKIINATLEKAKQYRIFSFVVGKSSKLYTSLSNEKNSISIFNPKDSSIKKIFSDSNKNACINQLSISPDEKKLAFVRTIDCEGFSRGDELHVFDITTGTDKNYGNKEVLSFSEFSWSPDSQFLYYLKAINWNSGGKNSAIYRIKIN